MGGFINLWWVEDKNIVEGVLEGIFQVGGMSKSSPSGGWGGDSPHIPSREKPVYH